MTEYKDFKQLRTRHPLLDDISRRPSDLRLLLVSQDEIKRLQACEFFKGLLEEKLEEEKIQGRLQGYEVTIMDLRNEKRNYADSDVFERSGIHEGRLFIPIYHNADNQPGLPQITFDRTRPGIFSYTQEGWMNITNVSKRNCYSRVDV
ncbi:MAG: hypothetical protein WC979_08955 [Candidatus Pacearchaeota archaeon]|jgi:hypothetical protein